MDRDDLEAKIVRTYCFSGEKVNLKNCFGCIDYIEKQNVCKRTTAKYILGLIRKAGWRLPKKGVK